MFTPGCCRTRKNSRENSLRLNSRRNRLAAAPVKSVFKVGQGKKKKLAGRPGNRKPCQRHSLIRAGRKISPNCRGSGEQGTRKCRSGGNTWENGVQHSEHTAWPKKSVRMNFTLVNLPRGARPIFRHAYAFSSKNCVYRATLREHWTRSASSTCTYVISYRVFSTRATRVGNSVNSTEAWVISKVRWIFLCTGEFRAFRITIFRNFNRTFARW